MLERLQEIFAETLRKWDCKLIEFNGEKDHVHLLFKTTPNLQMSVLINNLKTVSSRLIRKEGIAQIRQGAHEKCHDSVRHFCRFFRADFGLSLPK